MNLPIIIILTGLAGLALGAIAMAVITSGKIKHLHHRIAALDHESDNLCASLRAAAAERAELRTIKYQRKRALHAAQERNRQRHIDKLQSSAGAAAKQG